MILLIDNKKIKSFVKKTYTKRFWRTIKYEHIYLNPSNREIELLKALESKPYFQE